MPASVCESVITHINSHIGCIRGFGEIINASFKVGKLVDTKI